MARHEKEQQVQPQTDVVVAAVLRHFSWSVAAVEGCYFADEQRIRGAIGLLQYFSFLLLYNT